MDSDNASSDKVGFVQDAAAVRSLDGKTSPPTSPSPVSSVSGSTEAAGSNISSTNKVLGHNYNGTVVFTSSPKNEAELQLYRVMQRASLLSYFDTLLEMGGDDVQQLCDAGEEEFLEIMALVGMASKPLHVRRFQKALREWLSNPLIFQTPVTTPGTVPNLLPRPLSVQNVSSSPMSCSPAVVTVTPASSPSSGVLQQLGEISSCTPSTAASPAHGSSCSISPGPSPSSPLPSQNNVQPTLDDRQIRKLEETALRVVQSLPELEPKYRNTKKKAGDELQDVLNMKDEDPERMKQIRKFSAIYGRFDCKRNPEKPLSLHEVSVNEAAAQLCKYIPALLTRRDDLFPLARQVVRDSGYPYSKGHSKSFAVSNLKRSTGTPLFNTCKYNDNFIKRNRYSDDFAGVENASKRQERLEQLQSEITKVTSRLTQLNNEMQNISEETSEFSALKYQIEAVMNQKSRLIEEQTILLSLNYAPKKRGRKPSSHNLYSNYEKIETDDFDSQHSFSNASSPYPEIENSNDSMHEEQEDLKDCELIYAQTANSSEEDKNAVSLQNHVPFPSSEYKDPFHREDKFQVIATKGNDIIAVTNPALLMSSNSLSDTTELIFKKERLSPIEQVDS